MKFKLLTTIALGVLAGMSSLAYSAETEKAEFPIGFYSADPANETTFSRIKELGGNYVHTYGMGHDNVRDKRFLDLAQKYNLKVLFNLRGRDWVKKTDNTVAFKATINKFKDHPALGMWYLYDEPNPKLLPKLRILYDIIKAESPDVPVALVTPWVTYWYRLARVTDILMVDNYPVRDQVFPNAPVNSIITFTSRAINQKKPVIPVFQAIHWKIFAQQLKGKGYNESKYRFPNKQELRYWAFATLCLGVKGHFYYSYYNAYHRCKGAKWLQEDLKPVISETKLFTKAVTPSFVPTKKYNFDKQKVLAGIWKAKNKSFMVVVNNSDKARNLELELPGISSKLIPWGDSRKVSTKVRGNKLSISDKVNPWEVLIWNLK
jgi:hypothetical protein